MIGTVTDFWATTTATPGLVSRVQFGGERVLVVSKKKSLAEDGQDKTTFFPEMLTLSFGRTGGGLEPGLSRI